MREWTEWEMNFSAGGFLSSTDGYCSTEPLQYYDMLADPLGYPLQDPDLQLLPYSQQQYNPASLPFPLYGSPPSSTSSPSSSSSSSQPCHPQYHYSPHCLEPPCDPSPEPHCGGLVQGLGVGGLPLVRRTRVGLGGKGRVRTSCVWCVVFLQFNLRSVTKKAVYHCKSGGGCEMDMYMRRKCQDCRLKKCQAVGMLAECLLTEVQCQSKRLRKGGKGRGQEEEENTDSRRVSSTSRLPAQALSASLSREQKYLVDRMVEAHRQYRAQDSSHCRLFEWPCAEEGESLSEVLSPNMQRLLQFARTVPGFDLLDFSDQSSLLSVSSLEVMFLLSAQQFSHNPTSPSPALQLFSMSPHNWLRNVESKENIHSRTPVNSGSSEDLFGPVLNFFHSMATLRVTEAEYTLLTATALLCSDRASLRAANCVEKMQELILDLLSRVCGAQAGAARGGPQRFGRLLGRLTELRTLRHNYLLLMRQQPGL
uniref:Nuclear receptor subfamily 1, group H, member 5 n=1 Tax=Labrus bergylta TaxID=56723 RepID=A0A3Q3FEG4_9LABR